MYNAVMKLKSTRALSVTELLMVVVAAAAVLATIFPVFQFQKQRRLVRLMRFQEKTIESWLTAYYSKYGDYPRPTSNKVNSYNESMVAALRAAKVVDERLLANWLGDGDGDKASEMVDPWGNPWIYFHPGTYNIEPPQYKLGERVVVVRPAKSGDNFQQPTRFQVWSCGPNETDETGMGDDCGNVN